MKIPEGLEPLIEHGLIDDIRRSLKSGKEAQVFLVEADGEERIAKVYKDFEQRSFKNRAVYTEGRQVRNSRDQRAMSRRSSYGREQDEATWREAESEIIATLHAAGARVPRPFVFFEGVLVMELVRGSNGEPAPRLAEVELSVPEREKLFPLILHQIVLMLMADIVHGDLSVYNILLAEDGPVVIDFPQAVDATANANARELLVRDVRSLTATLLGHQKHHKKLQYGEELWDIYRRGELTEEVKLTGKYVEPEIDVDTANLLAEIAYFEEQERKKREALGLPVQGKKRGQAPPEPKTPTGHEEMERAAALWEEEEAAQQGRQPRQQQERRNDRGNGGSSESRPRRRGRPERRKE